MQNQRLEIAPKFVYVVTGLYTLYTYSLQGFAFKNWDLAPFLSCYKLSVFHDVLSKVKEVSSMGLGKMHFWTAAATQEKNDAFFQAIDSFFHHWPFSEQAKQDYSIVLMMDTVTRCVGL